MCADASGLRERLKLTYADEAADEAFVLALGQATAAGLHSFSDEAGAVDVINGVLQRCCSQWRIVTAGATIPRDKLPKPDWRRFADAQVHRR